MLNGAAIVAANVWEKVFTTERTKSLRFIHVGLLNGKRKRERSMHRTWYAETRAPSAEIRAYAPWGSLAIASNKRSRAITLLLQKTYVQ